MLRRFAFLLILSVFIVGATAQSATAQFAIANITLTNTSDLNALSGVQGNMVEKRSTLELVSQGVSEDGHPVFTVRFAQLVAADQDAAPRYPGFPSNSHHQGRFKIAFDVFTYPGGAWQLYIETSRKGAVDLVYDETFPTAFASAGPLGSETSVTATGVTRQLGSLTLSAFSSAPIGATSTTPFNQWIYAFTKAVWGSRHVEFETEIETYSAGSVCSGGGCWGQEAAVRMGIPSSLQIFSAGNYPGLGGRIAAEDGYFVRIELTPVGQIPIPEIDRVPVHGGAGMALCLGLTGLGWLRLRRRANNAG